MDVYLPLMYYFRVQTYDPKDLVMMPETTGFPARHFLILYDPGGGISSIIIRYLDFVHYPVF